VLEQWFAWRPVKTSRRVVWLDWVWRITDEDATTRYLVSY
jgi:hypothetical protein